MSRLRGLVVIMLALSASARAQHGHGITINTNTELHFFANVDALKNWGISLPADAPNLTATQSALQEHPWTFRLGSLDLYFFSHLGQFSLLSETGFEPTPDSYSLDVERLQATWTPASWFQVSFGRYHTPLGYWNTAYHHGRWLFTTADSPLLFRFEDEGGPLPVHTIGILLFGDVDLGPAVLHYDAGVGNGRGPEPDPPVKLQSLNERKSLLLGLHVSVGGFRVGVAGFLDRFQPKALSGEWMSEQIGVGDITYTTAPWEILIEGAAIRHKFGTADIVNYGYYAQLAYQLTERWKPYARGEVQHINPSEPYLTASPFLNRAFGGVRFDPIEIVALKLEGGVNWHASDTGPFIHFQTAFVY